MSGDPYWDELAELDDARSDALLEGRTSPGNIPSGYEDVAHLVAVIQRGVEPDELKCEPPTVIALLALLNHEHDPEPVRAAPGRRHGRKRAVFAGAAIGMLLSAGTAAAATGHLPAAIQEVAHHVAAELGISIPGPAVSVAKGKPNTGYTCEHTGERNASTGGTSLVLWCEGPNGPINAGGALQPFDPELRAVPQARKPTRVVSTRVAPSRLSTSLSATAGFELSASAPASKPHPAGAVPPPRKSASPPNSQGRGPTGGQTGKTGGPGTPRSGGPQSGTTVSPRRSDRQGHSRRHANPRNTGKGRVSGHAPRRAGSTGPVDRYPFH
jgi:hypothetical protein